MDMSAMTLIEAKKAYKKLLSSAGQHFAFLGMSDDAIGMFKDALDSFSRLAGAALDAGKPSGL